MSSFKEWIGTKSDKFKKLFGQNRIIKPLSVGTMIVTADNKWIIGRRLKTYDFEGQYTLLAGYMDPDKDLVNSKPDPFFAIKREIEEETGINKIEVLVYLPFYNFNFWIHFLLILILVDKRILSI
jgi:8-oxo-dGTP pyrophosphatase MutT (NUDIX family)